MIDTLTTELHSILNQIQRLNKDSGSHSIQITSQMVIEVTITTTHPANPPRTKFTPLGIAPGGILLFGDAADKTLASQVPLLLPSIFAHACFLLLNR